MEHLEGVRDRGEALLGLQRQPRVRRRHLDAQRCRVLRGEGGVRSWPARAAATIRGVRQDETSGSARTAQIHEDVYLTPRAGEL